MKEAKARNLPKGVELDLFIEKMALGGYGCPPVSVSRGMLPIYFGLTRGNQS